MKTLKRPTALLLALLLALLSAGCQGPPEPAPAAELPEPVKTVAEPAEEGPAEETPVEALPREPDPVIPASQEPSGEPYVPQAEAAARRTASRSPSLRAAATAAQRPSITKTSFGAAILPFSSPCIMTKHVSSRSSSAMPIASCLCRSLRRSPVRPSRRKRRPVFSPGKSRRRPWRKRRRSLPPSRRWSGSPIWRSASSTGLRPLPSPPR